mmetsp:Transcript_15343/g.18492  ORF Transcript_15343/g.18492 Transcript_15343/m.18492 type:complete len:276 (+) Transcript_15343:149-976(+)
MTTTARAPLLLLLLSAIFALALAVDHDLPGWDGETHNAGPLIRGGGVKRDHRQWIETISWEPRASIYHNFLTKDECLHLIHKAAPKMERSMTVDNDTGGERLDTARTSSGTFFKRGEDEVIRQIEDRLASWSMVPMEHGEGLQILHYEVGQQYQPHFDYFHDAEHQKNQRIATVLMYLTDVDEGGETLFPNGIPIPQKEGEQKSGKTSFSECVGKTASGEPRPHIVPRQGDALLFWSLHTDTGLDPSSLHASCPVIAGNKWSATKWMHVQVFKDG